MSKKKKKTGKKEAVLITNWSEKTVKLVTLLPFLFVCSIWLASSSVQPKWATTRSSRGVMSWVCRREEEEEEKEGATYYNPAHHALVDMITNTQYILCG